MRPELRLPTSVRTASIEKHHNQQRQGERSGVRASWIGILPVTSVMCDSLSVCSIGAGGGDPKDDAGRTKGSRDQIY